MVQIATYFPALKNRWSKQQDFKKLSSTSNASANHCSFYFKTDGHLYCKDENGTETRLNASINSNGDLVLTENDSPDTPAANTQVVYIKTDGKIYRKDENGTETEIGASGVTVADNYPSTYSVDDIVLLTPVIKHFKAKSTDETSDPELWIDENDQVGYLYDEFSTYANDTAFDAVWVPNLTMHNPDSANDELDFNLTPLADNQSLHYDLGRTIKKKWVLRMKLRVDTYVLRTSNAVYWYFGIWSSNGASSVSQDGLGMLILTNSAGSDFNGAGKVDGAAATSLSTQVQETMSAGTKYIEMIRDGDSFTTNVYSDEFVTQTSTKTATGALAIDSLRYIGFKRRDNIAADATANLAGAIEYIQFKEGVTSF